MSVIIVIELTCDRCEQTGEHRLDRATVVSAERFVQRRLAGWNVDPHGRALCPACVVVTGNRARVLKIGVPTEETSDGQ